MDAKWRVRMANKCILQTHWRTIERHVKIFVCAHYFFLLIYQMFGRLKHLSKNFWLILVWSFSRTLCKFPFIPSEFGHCECQESNSTDLHVRSSTILNLFLVWYLYLYIKKLWPVSDLGHLWGPVHGLGIAPQPILSLAQYLTAWWIYPLYH